jgi:prolipoprotein diacylglyceryltransferase
MIEAVQLGSLAISFGVIVFIVAALLAFLLARQLERQSGFPIVRQFGAVMLVGLIAARVLFLIAHANTYFAAPMQILNIFDGGFQAITGIGFAWFASLWMTRRQSAMRRPLMASVAVFSMLSLLGMALMMLPNVK